MKFKHIHKDWIVETDPSVCFWADALSSYLNASDVLEKASWMEIEVYLTAVENRLSKVQESRPKKKRLSLIKFLSEGIADLNDELGFVSRDPEKCIALGHIDEAIDYYYKNFEKIEKNTARDLAWAALIQAKMFLDTKRGRKIDAYLRVIEGATKGGKAHHSDVRQAFKNDYRAERDDDPTVVVPRPNIIAQLKNIYPDIATTTLEGWAKESDKEDGFNRPAGRPKKG